VLRALNSPTMAKKTTLKEFEAIFPKLEADLLEQVKSINLPEPYIEWYKKVSSPWLNYC
jgi:farnesyl diphosphate synthase